MLAAAGRVVGEHGGGRQVDKRSPLAVLPVRSERGVAWVGVAAVKADGLDSRNLAAAVG